MRSHAPRILLVLALLSPFQSVRAQTAARPSAAAADTEESEVDLDVAAALDRARSFYQVGSYDQCADAYHELLEPEGRVRGTSLEQARVYYAACLLALGRRQDADAQLRAAMKQNPLMASPDPVLFPAQVRDLFFQVKSDFLEEVRRAQDEQLKQAQRLEAEKAERARRERLRVQRLERLAAQEVVVHQNQRWVAALPFGIGQFQNGDRVLGALFLTTEAALLAATIAAVSRQLGIHSDADGGQNVRVADLFNEPLQVAHRVELLAGAGFIVLAGLGVLEAQLNFVPEVYVGTRPRRTHPEPLSAASTAPEGRAATFGFSGRF